MRKHLLLGIALLLASCGMTGDTYSHGTFSLVVPKGWVVAEPPYKGLDVAPETSAAFLKKDARSGNVVVTITERVLPPEDALRFSEAAEAVVRNMNGYTELSRERLQILERETAILRFMAIPPNRPQPEQFALLAYAMETSGYTLLARIPASIDEDTNDEVTSLLASFTPNVAATK